MSNITWFAANNYPRGEFEPVTTNYTYNGSYRTVTLSAGTYTFECWGADGGYYPSATAASGAEKIYGRGGYAKGTVKLTSTVTAYIYVGGQGSYITTTNTTIQGGGYPDGGDFRSSAWGRGGGGGSSSIRFNSTSNYNRVIVAGGAGGSVGKTNGFVTAFGGGHGGAETGQTGEKVTGTSPAVAGTGGSQNSGGTNSNASSLNGSFGQGGNATGTNNVAGGGGGWYGGAAGNSPGGGSNYVLTSSSTKVSGQVYNSSWYMTNVVSARYGDSDYVANPSGGHNGYIRITQTA